ncbi:MAG: DUF434 domain-containing protein [Myxococcota bacterium]
MASADPTDQTTFAARSVPRMQQGAAELSWLLARGYADAAALTLVGDHHQLTRRQRMAVLRAACPEPQRRARAARRVAALGGQPLAVDGFNQLVTTERALAGGAVFRGRDGALRDVAGVHGTWRRSERTADALARLVAAAVQLGAGPVTWVLDAPVSNSGRLAGLLRERDPSAEVRVVDRADAELLVLAEAGCALATADAALLDRCGAWLSLTELALPAEAWIVELGGAPLDTEPG